MIDSIEDLVPGWMIVLTFGLIIILSLLGNTSMALAIYSSRSLKKVTSMFMMSLSLSNLMVGVINTTLALIRIHWQNIISGFVCQISLTIELYSVTTSVFSLLFVSVDRYVAVIHPTKKFQKRMAVGVLAFIWLGGFLYSSRFLFQYSVNNHRPSVGSDDVTTTSFRPSSVGHSSANATAFPPPASTEFQQSSTTNTVTLPSNGLGKFGDGDQDDGGDVGEDNDVAFDQSCNFLMEDDTDDLPYRSIDLLVLFVVPFSAMCYMYSCVGRKLWGKELAVTDTVRRKRKIVKLLIVDILIFIFSWIPFYMIEFISDSLELIEEEPIEEIDPDPAYVMFRFLFVVIALSSAFMIPVVSLVFYDTLRVHIVKIFVRMKCCWSQNRVVVSTNRVEPLTSSTFYNTTSLMPLRARTTTHQTPHSLRPPGQMTRSWRAINCAKAPVQKGGSAKNDSLRNIPGM